MKMSNRKSHAPKTPYERRNYLGQVTGGTNDQPDLASSNSSSALLAEQPALSPTRPRPKSFSLAMVGKYKNEIFVGVVVTLLSIILGYLVSSNREIGEIKRDVQNIDTRLQKAEGYDFSTLVFKVNELWEKTFHGKGTGK